MTRADDLTVAYMSQVGSIRDRVVAYARAMWQGSVSLRDRDIDRLVSRIVPVVQGGQMQVANITNAYVQRVALAEGVTAAATAVNVGEIVNYRGVPATDVYRRPATTTYTALAGGRTFGAARAAGLNRLTSLVMTDIQQSRNRQSQAAYSGTGFDYTIRVLTGAENCALCVIASTQRYRAKDLLPIHPGCDCAQRGVRAGRDPGQVIDPELLELTHEQISVKLGSYDRGARDLGLGKTTSRGDSISDYTDLIITREHGELGPTLAWRSDNFTAAADIEALH